MKKLCIVFLAVFFVSCSTLIKDGVYELSVENVNFTLELPCKDENTAKFKDFQNALYNETKLKLEDLSPEELVLGKLTIDNKTDSYLQEGSSPLKIVLNNDDNKTIEGIPAERMFQMLRNAAQEKGKSVQIRYTSGIKEYAHSFFGEKLLIEILEKDEIAQKIMTIRSELGTLSLEALPAVLIVKVQFQNEGEKEIKNKAKSPYYGLNVTKKSRDVADGFPLVIAMEKLQKMIEQKMNAEKKDTSKYNSYVYLYNSCAEVIRDGLKEKDEVIRKGETSVDYFVVENAIRDEVASIGLKGGDFANAGEELRKKMIEGYSMPVNPKTKSVAYFGFPKYNAVEVKKIYLNIGQLVEEMR
ncbi:MAG: hypothetical protein A2Y62_05485 [Candidatus Fischerbacteria bacterium RBG_13_37_8]|uniref:Lipoprotein n=1 Tax=Candidatus Fischerbacteria bacterium RBG_13_37_8 TaxID=1817863 RepID=A0A1F5VY45_9BACT|nr:MAG: hypothetical protein A2Y62_05485 [Candidatus Fischerbacteria bacterium RBG_13_37_8]